MKPLHFADNRYRPAMQFHEIARVLHTTVGSVQHSYRQAMRKIAEHPGMQEALALAAMVDRLHAGTPLRLQRKNFVTTCAPTQASELTEYLP